MGREQLRGCSHSLLMQEVRRCELSPGSTLAQSRATNQVRERRTLPLSPRGDLWQDATSALPTTSPHADAHILMWLTLHTRFTQPKGRPCSMFSFSGSHHFPPQNINSSSPRQKKMWFRFQMSAIASDFANSSSLSYKRI